MYRNVIVALIGVVLFFFIINLIPVTSTTGVTNYAPNGYSFTMKAKLNGLVVSISEPGLFYIILNNDPVSYPIGFDDFKLPKDWRSVYPAKFILIGDSIAKESNNDTFYVFRDSLKSLYILPGPFSK